MFVNLTNVPVALASPGTVTVTAADPAVVAKTAHGLLDGTPLTFTTSSVLPAGIVLGTTYYTKSIDADHFKLSKTFGGTDWVATTTTGTGTLTATATDVVATINTESVRTLGLEIKNTGSNPLDVFDVYVKMTPDANLVKVSTVATDYTNAVYPITKASASPVTLASAATVWMFMDVTGVAQVVLKASSGTGATKLDIHAATKFMV